MVRSARRVKTVQARLVAGKLRIAIPDRLSEDEESHWVEVMTQRFARRQRSREVELEQRTWALARRHGLPEPAEIMWSERQRTLWGSCSPTTRRIRISRVLVDFPSWVLDYVIVHELAHLVEPSHNDAFWGLVNRYPLAERARGYLMAKSGESSDEAPDDSAPDDAGEPCADFPSDEPPA